MKIHVVLRITRFIRVLSIIVVCVIAGLYLPWWAWIVIAFCVTAVDICAHVEARLPRDQIIEMYRGLEREITRGMR